MDSTPNNGKLLFDVGGTFLKAVIADGNGRFVPDTEYSVPMPSDGPREEIEQALIAAVERGMRSAADRMHGNRLPRAFRLRTRHSADDAQIPEHIRHIAARPAPHTYGCGTDDARSVHARRERRDAGRNALRKRPGLRQRSAHRPRNGTRVRLLSRRRGAIRSDRFPSATESSKIMSPNADSYDSTAR